MDKRKLLILSVLAIFVVAMSLFAVIEPYKLKVWYKTK